MRLISLYAASSSSRPLQIMKLCDNMDEFRAKFSRVFKKTAVSDQMRFDWEPEK